MELPPATTRLGRLYPLGSQAPIWNGVLFEPHYVYSPQLIFIGRYTITCRSGERTACATVGAGRPHAFQPRQHLHLHNRLRYNPFMTSRAGFAWHNEYNWLHQDGTGPANPTT